MEAEPAVRVTGLVKRYGPKTAVDGLNLTVGRGRVTAVLGPNGAGKTTTIETCEGYRHPDAGTVRVLGLGRVGVLLLQAVALTLTGTVLIVVCLNISGMMQVRGAMREREL